MVASRRPPLGNMHHDKQVTHSSSSLPLTFVSGFGEFGEGCPTMVASRRPPSVNMHHDKQQNHSSSSLPFTLVTRMRDFRFIATPVTGSGQSRRDAAGSFHGELANSLERESEGKPGRDYFVE